MTTSLSGLKTALENILITNTGQSLTVESQAAIEDICTAIDAYIIEVVSRVTGTSSVSTVVAFPIPVQVVPATGTGGTTAPGSGTGTGTIVIGNLVTN